MHSVFKKAAAAAVAAVAGLGLMTGCGSSQPKVDGTETLLTVNDDSIDVGVGSFFVKYQQASMYSAYGSYFGTNGFFDQTANSSTGATYGDNMKDNVIESLERMMVCEQHASDYNVSITDAQNSEIEAAAQAYIDNNDETVRDMVGASKDDVIRLLELQTISSEMMDPMVADADTDVTDEEAQQTTLSYITFTPETDSAASSTASGTESTSEADAAAAAQSKAQQVLDLIEAQDDPATADMTSLAQQVDSSLSASTGQFSTNDTTDTTVDSAIVEACAGLTDGQVVDHVVTSSDGNTYYVVRVTAVNDATATETKKASLVNQKKQDAYQELIDGWIDAATIKVNEEAWSQVKVSDKYPVTLAESTAESAASSTESSVSSAETSVSSTASAESGASSAASTESTGSAASSTASEASSAESAS